MKPKNTQKLMETLKNSSLDDFKKYSSDNIKNDNFVSLIDSHIDQKNIKRKDLFIKANISEKSGYKILSGEIKTKNRDRLLRILISLELKLDEMQTALKLYGFSPLYPKVKRDSLIILTINNGIRSVDEVNEILLEHNFEELHQ